MSQHRYRTTLNPCSTYPKYTHTHIPKNKNIFQWSYLSLTNSVNVKPFQFETQIHCKKNIKFETLDLRREDRATYGVMIVR